MADEPGLGIFMVKLDSLISQVADLVREVRTDYVRKELYESQHKTFRVQLERETRERELLEAEVNEREKSRLAFQRQISAGVIVGLILLIASTAVSVLLLVGGIQ